jgi:uncharacterized SAM-binding protein YcdF (DUF218 family)
VNAVAARVTPRARDRAARAGGALLAVVVIATAYYGVGLAEVWWTGRQEQAVPVDAIVVLGAAQYDGRPSPVLAARLDHALELWQEGLAPRIVVTGGRQPGDRFTEAQASASYLIDRGVPDEAILREVQGTTSWESLAAAARILRQRGLASVVLVSDPYHAKRIAGIAEELGLTAFTSPTRTSPDRGSGEVRHYLREAAGVGVARFIGYRRLLRLDVAAS